MSKIYIADHLGSHKTTIQLEKWFSTHGHEVHWNMYYEPREAEWCDVMIFEWFEGMMELALKAGWGKRKPVYCRAMDIEIWANNAAGADLTDLSGLAYTSKAYFEILKKRHDLSKFPKLKLAHIPLSIDMNEWKYEERKPGYNVGILGHMWDAKGPNLLPHFVYELIKRTGNNQWKFYVQGNWRHDVWEWYLYYFKHIVKEMGLENNIFVNEERVEDMNGWYEKMNYLVTFSMKDAFSIPVAEAMAKGIKAIPHNFMGAKDIWGKYVWTTFDDLYQKLIDQKLVGEPYNSIEYHTFVKDNYSNEAIMPKWQQFLNL